MQALASYSPHLHPGVQAALSDLEERDWLNGLARARPHLLDGRTYAKFMWADWPEDLSASLSQRVENFLKEHSELQRLEEHCEDWQAVFGGETDAGAAAEIGRQLLAHFPEAEREHWAIAQRDRRGKVVAWSFTNGIGEILWNLSWYHVSADPAGRKLSAADVQKLNAAIDDVYRWASGRIRPILDALSDKLSSLYCDRFRGLYVFGSYARPDAGIELPIDSDLDVALILSDFGSVPEERERFGDVVYDLSLEHGLAISVVPVREAEYRDRTSSFAREISSYAVPAR